MNVDFDRYSLRCEICNNMTNGYECKGYIICGFCNEKYKHIPDYISIGQWGKYARIERKKKKDAGKLSLL